MLNRWCSLRVSLPLCLNLKIPEPSFFVFTGALEILGSPSRTARFVEAAASLFTPLCASALSLARARRPQTRKPAARTRTANPRRTSGIRAAKMESEVCALVRIGRRCETELPTMHVTKTTETRRSDRHQPFSRARDVHRATSLFYRVIVADARGKSRDFDATGPSTDRARALHQRSSVARLLDNAGTLCEFTIAVTYLFVILRASESRQWFLECGTLDISRKCGQREIAAFSE